MPFQPVLEPQPLLMPSLLPPLVLRTENGFFGAPRGTSPASAAARPAPASRNRPLPRPTRTSRTGRSRRPASSRRRCTRRWTWRASDALCVERGDAVAKGDLIGRLGTGPADPHLHFELRVVLDRSQRKFWTDRNSVGVDPTRLLYRFEADALPLLQAAAAAVTSIGVQTVAKVPLFRAGTDASEIPFSIPLHEPVSEHERVMAAVFTSSLELGRQVAVEYRESRFFGEHRVPASVHLV